MTTEDDFRRKIDANPEDWQTLLVFSDWLDERSDPRAAGYRLLSRLRKNPKSEQVRAKHAGNGADWRVWVKAGVGHRDWVFIQLDDSEGLPPDWFDTVAGFSELPDWPPAVWAYFRSRFAALNAAAVGFSTLPIERRTELLASSD